MARRLKLLLGGALLTVIGLTTVPAERAYALPNECDACNAYCTLDYQEGWNDCGGPPRSCIRVTVCG